MSAKSGDLPLTQRPDPYAKPFSLYPQAITANDPLSPILPERANPNSRKRTPQNAPPRKLIASKRGRKINQYAVLDKSFDIGGGELIWTTLWRGPIGCEKVVVRGRGTLILLFGNLVWILWSWWVGRCRHIRVFGMVKCRIEKKAR